MKKHREYSMKELDSILNNVSTINSIFATTRKSTKRSVLAKRNAKHNVATLALKENIKNLNDFTLELRRQIRNEIKDAIKESPELKNDDKFMKILYNQYVTPIVKMANSIKQEDCWFANVEIVREIYKNFANRLENWILYWIRTDGEK